MPPELARVAAPPGKRSHLKVTTYGRCKAGIYVIYTLAQKMETIISSWVLGVLCGDVIGVQELRMLRGVRVEDFDSRAYLHQQVAAIGMAPFQQVRALNRYPACPDQICRRP